MAGSRLLGICPCRCLIGVLRVGRALGPGRSLSSAHAATAADLGHVLAVHADDLADLTAGCSRLFGSELVSLALLVRGAASKTGDLTLLVAIHGGEASLRRAVLAHSAVTSFPYLVQLQTCP